MAGGEEQWTSVRWRGREGHVWRFHSIGEGAMRGRTQLLQSGSDSAAGGTSQAPRGGTSAQDDGRIKSEAPTHRLRHEAAGKDLLGPKLSSAMNGYNRYSSPWMGAEPNVRSSGDTRSRYTTACWTLVLSVFPKS